MDFSTHKTVPWVDFSTHKTVPRVDFSAHKTVPWVDFSAHKTVPWVDFSKREGGEPLPVPRLLFYFLYSTTASHGRMLPAFSAGAG